MHNASVYGYCVLLRTLCRWHPRIVSCSIRSTDPRVFFHSYFSKELVLYEMYFFLSLNNCNPPIPFESYPLPLPLQDVAQCDLTAQQHSTIQRNRSWLQPAGSRPPLLQPTGPSITSKQVQNMVLHLQHWHCFLTTQIPAEFLLFPISMATVYFFSSSQSLNWSRIPMLLQSIVACVHKRLPTDAFVSWIAFSKEKYKLWSFSLSNYRHPLTSCFLSNYFPRLFVLRYSQSFS